MYIFKKKKKPKMDDLKTENKKISFKLYKYYMQMCTI